MVNERPALLSLSSLSRPFQHFRIIRFSESSEAEIQLSICRNFFISPFSNQFVDPIQPDIFGPSYRSNNH